MILLGKRVMVKEEPVEKKSAGGILLTTERTDYRKPVMSIIVNADEALKEVNIHLTEAGKFYAMYMPGAGIDYKVGEDTFKILNYEDIISLIPVEEV